MYGPIRLEKEIFEIEIPHEELRLKYVIDVNEVIPPPQVALYINNEIFGTLGNFSLITGKAKAKKSFMINMAVACALTNETLHGILRSELPPEQNQVLYIDTEQSKHHFQKAVKRICEQLNTKEPSNLIPIYLRTLTPEQRLKFVENEIYRNSKIGFVVIDGIKDLVTSINDEGEATMIASKLLKWTEERNIHIVTVLHQNKGDNNARGHIGSELINKAETVLSVSVVENDKDVSIVEPQQCRNREPDNFSFSVDAEGLPFIIEGYNAPIKRNNASFSAADLDDFKKYQLLTEVYSHDKEYKYGALVSQMKIAYKNQLGKDLGENRIKDLLTTCKNNGWLLQLIPKGSYTLGDFTGDFEPDFEPDFSNIDNFTV